MTQSNFITAIFHKDHWRVDGMFCGDREQMGGRANVWAKCAKDIRGNGPQTLVVEVADNDEAGAIYRSKRITMREAELMGAGVMA